LRSPFTLVSFRYTFLVGAVLQQQYKVNVVIPFFLLVTTGCSLILQMSVTESVLEDIQAHEIPS